MKISVKLSLFSLVVVSAMGLLAQVIGWPTVQPLEEKHVFNGAGQDGSDTSVLAFIKDTHGTPVYKLECHNGNYDNESEMNFSGDFQCALFAVKGKTLTSGDLLASDTKNELSTDWWNRGRMRAAQLRGACLQYPEYSTERHFKLRGMLLALNFTNIQWSPRQNRQGDPPLTGFTFTVKVVPDESANSSRAELAAGPIPPAACYP